jgi:hypothetical protein
MLIKTLNGWNLAEYTVRYTQRGEEIEQIVGEEGKEWWLDFADKWDHTQIIEFTDLHYTPEQVARLEEIQEIGEGYMEACSDYVLNGNIPDAEPFETMKLKQLLADLTEVVLLGGAQ